MSTGAGTRDARPFRRLQVPPVRSGPTVFLQLAFEFELPRVQRVSIGKSLDVFLPLFIDDAELEFAGRQLSRLVPEQIVLSLEPPEHLVAASKNTAAP
jgi:hypothetical protein